MHSEVVCLTTLVLVASWFGAGVHGKECYRLVDGCGCLLEDEGIINLASLSGSGGKPRFENALGEDRYSYSYDPCQPFSQGSCSGAAVCQVSADRTAYYQAGDANSVVWSFDNTNVVAYYTSTTETFRESFVTFICDNSASDPKFRAFGEDNPGFAQYYFEVRSKCACPNGCGGGGGDDDDDDDDDLSPGSILVIVVGALFFVYLAAGMVFKRTRQQATGVEMVPNIGLWRSLPGAIKDGCVFTFSKIRGGVSKKSGYDEV